MEGIDKSEFAKYGIKQTEKGGHNYMLTHMIDCVGSFENGIDITENYKSFRQNAENGRKECTRCTIQYENNKRMNVESYGCLGMYLIKDTLTSRCLIGM